MQPRLLVLFSCSDEEEEGAQDFPESGGRKNGPVGTYVSDKPNLHIVVTGRYVKRRKTCRGRKVVG